MWDPHGPWIEHMSPALQCGFFTTEPTGKPSTNLMLPKETPWFLLLPNSVNDTTQLLKPDPGILSLMLSSPQHSMFNPSSSLTLVSPPLLLGSPGGSAVKNLPAVQVTQKTWVWSLGQEDPLEKEMATPLQYSCLGNPTDRRAWWSIVHRVTKESDTT